MNAETKTLKLSHLVGHLGQTPLLRELSKDCIHQIALNSKVVEYRKDVLVVKANEPADRIGFLLLGQLKVVHVGENYIESEISFINAPIEFGELSIIDKQPRSASLVTNERCVIAWLDGTLFLEMILRNQELNLSLLRSVSHKVRLANDQIFILSRKSAKSRLIAFFLRSKLRDVGGNVFALKLPTQSELASITNTTRETISRNLKQLDDEGFIKRIKKEIIIPSIEKLETLLLELEHEDRSN